MKSVSCWTLQFLWFLGTDGARGDIEVQCSQDLKAGLAWMALNLAPAFRNSYSSYVSKMHRGIPLLRRRILASQLLRIITRYAYSSNSTYLAPDVSARDI